MSRHANPVLIGAFVLGALALSVTVLLLLAGGQLFQQHHQYVLYFDEAAEGLQVGAPVVFLGVRVGTVTKIQLGLNRENHRFLVPVTIELESHQVPTGAGGTINLQDRATIKDLVGRGLRARLKVQSLLTGQRYVDLDFYPGKPARFVGTEPEQSEIPTIPTTVEELTSMLEGFPMKDFLADLAAISRSLKTLLGAEATARIPQQVSAVLGQLEALTARLTKESGPLLEEMRSDLQELSHALTAVQAAMTRVGTAADHVAALTAPDSPVAASITLAGKELAGAAATLQNLADDKSPSVQHLTTAADEVARAAKALRQLAETLEQQPEALLKGKQAEEGWK